MDPQAILGPDPKHLKTLMSHLIVKNTSNEQLSQAESLLNSCIQTDPNTLARKLGNLLEEYDTNIHERAMSAILLRNLLKQNDLETLVQLMNLAVLGEKNKPIIKILANTISKLAADNSWPEDKTMMLLDLVGSDDPWFQESVLVILAQYAGASLVPRTEYLHRVFRNCLGNVNGDMGDLRIAALSAAINFIPCLTDCNMFQDLLPLMTQCLTLALNKGEEPAQKALVLLLELAGTKLEFFEAQLEVVVEIMLQIAEDIAEAQNIAELEIIKAKRLKEGTRNLAIEFVITLAEARLGLSPLIICRLFAILMTMLSDIEDEAAWHLAENEDEDESSNYSVGKEFLDRLVTALGEDTIVLVECEQLSAYLAALEWQKRLAGLVALARIAKGRSKVEIRNLEQLVTMVLNSFQDPDHLSVRWAAINAIGQLSAYVGPSLLSQHHNRVLPALASALNDIQNPRVQLQYLRLVLRALAAAISDNPYPGSHRGRLAAINATGQFFTDLDRDLQLKYRHLVLPEGIYDFQYPQVEERAASAMINISNNNPVTPELLKIAANLLKGLKGRCFGLTGIRR